VFSRGAPDTPGPFASSRTSGQRRRPSSATPASRKLRDSRAVSDKCSSSPGTQGDRAGDFFFSGYYPIPLRPPTPGPGQKITESIAAHHGGRPALAGWPGAIGAGMVEGNSPTATNTVALPALIETRQDGGPATGQPLSYAAVFFFSTRRPTSPGVRAGAAPRSTVRVCEPGTASAGGALDLLDSPAWPASSPDPGSRPARRRVAIRAPVRLASDPLRHCAGRR